MPHKVGLLVNNPCESRLFRTTITLCTKSSIIKLSYWKVHPQGIPGNCIGLLLIYIHQDGLFIEFSLVSLVTGYTCCMISCYCG